MYGERRPKLAINHEVLLPYYDDGLKSVLRDIAGAPAKARVSICEKGIRLTWAQERKLKNAR